MEGLLETYKGIQILYNKESKIMRTDKPVYHNGKCLAVMSNIEQGLIVAKGVIDNMPDRLRPLNYSFGYGI